MRRYIFFILLSILGLACAYMLVPKNTAKSTIRFNLPHMESKRQVFEMLPIDSTDIVFVGSSLTEAFPISEMAGSTNIKNRGVASYRSGDLMQIIPDIVKGRPEKIFLEIGCNDIENKIPVDSVMENIRIVYSYIKSNSPRTKIFIQSQLPVYGEFERSQGGILVLNQKLKEFCTNRGAVYIDLHSMFQKDEKMNEKYSLDGMHLNGDGYYLWKTSVEKYF